ncbi:MAG TPA: hypothetical protein DEG43_06860 [Acidimicrobiaceae bacterium]|nr:hypothetical protein [Acidimicrobiaceae bacterium]
MDVVELIVAALGAGAVAGLGEAASSAVKDTYVNLRDRIQVLLGGSGQGLAALAALEASGSDRAQAVLEEELGMLDPDKLVPAAEDAERLSQLLALAPGGVVINGDAKGLQVGNENVQFNRFA